MLCDRGADVYAANKDSITPLSSAAEFGHTAIAIMLCGRDADMNAAGEYCNTPLILATENGHTDVATMLRDVARMST